MSSTTGTVRTARRRLAYLALTLTLMFILQSLAGYGYTGYVDSQRQKAEAAAAAQRAEAAEQTRQIVCALANGYLRAFQENPPPTRTGQDVQRTWDALAKRLQCGPP